MATPLSLQPHSSPADVHSLPCSVDHEGPAEVSKFFTSAIQRAEGGKQEQEVLQVGFRGRFLQGAKVALPPGYSGLVLARQQQEQGTGGPGGAAWTAQQRFGALTAWNHDTAPQRTDPLQRCLDWAALAAQLHQPVSVEAVEAALATQSLPAL